MGLADGVIEAAQGRCARGPRAHRDHARPHHRILADNKKNKKQVKWLTPSVIGPAVINTHTFNGEEKFLGFFYKKRILFPFGKKRSALDPAEF